MKSMGRDIVPQSGLCGGSSSPPAHSPDRGKLLSPLYSHNKLSHKLGKSKSMQRKRRNDETSQNEEYL